MSTIFVQGVYNSCTMAAMEKVTRNFSIDSDILKALRSYANNVTRENMSSVVQRFVREGLERAGAWPPKKTK